MSVTIRPATVADLPNIFRFIHDLAEYEKAEMIVNAPPNNATT